MPLPKWLSWKNVVDLGVTGSLYVTSGLTSMSGKLWQTVGIASASIVSSIGLDVLQMEDKPARLAILTNADLMQQETDEATATEYKEEVAHILSRHDSEEKRSNWKWGAGIINVLSLGIGYSLTAWKEGIDSPWILLPLFPACMTFHLVRKYLDMDIAEEIKELESLRKTCREEFRTSQSQRITDLKQESEARQRQIEELQEKQKQQLKVAIASAQKASEMASKLAEQLDKEKRNSDSLREQMAHQLEIVDSLQAKIIVQSQSLRDSQAESERTQKAQAHCKNELGEIEAQIKILKDKLRTEAANQQKLQTGLEAAYKEADLKRASSAQTEESAQKIISPYILRLTQNASEMGEVNAQLKLAAANQVKLQTESKAIEAAQRQTDAKLGEVNRQLLASRAALDTANNKLQELKLQQEKKNAELEEMNRQLLVAQTQYEMNTKLTQSLQIEAKETQSKTTDEKSSSSSTSSFSTRLFSSAQPSDRNSNATTTLPPSFFSLSSTAFDSVTDLHMSSRSSSSSSDTSLQMVSISATSSSSFSFFPIATMTMPLSSATASSSSRSAIGTNPSNKVVST